AVPAILVSIPAKRIRPAPRRPVRRGPAVRLRPARGRPAGHRAGGPAPTPPRRPPPPPPGPHRPAPRAPAPPHRPPHPRPAPAAGALPPLPPDSTVPSTAPGDSATDRSTATRDTAQETARVPPDSVRTPLVIPDSTWRWPEDARATTCTGPLETMTACWRSPGATAEIAARETGFPGIRATALALRGLEPARTEAFFQPALAFSPYGTGGQRPFTRFEADAARGLVVERWAPVQPLDTPVTDLHWMRGALLMNQFGITLHRMVGNRAYVGFDYL